MHTQQSRLEARGCRFNPPLRLDTAPAPEGGALHRGILIGFLVGIACTGSLALAVATILQS